MPLEVSSDPVYPEEAIRFFRGKIGVTEDEWDELEDQNHDLSFKLAGISDIDVVDDVWSAIDDAITNGTTLEDFKEKVIDELMNSWGGSVANPGWRVECLAPSTPVTGAMVRAVHRRWYEGLMVEVITAGGRQFTTTPNHPMLSRRGWLGTGQLSIGDDLICYRRQQCHGSFGNENIANPPPSIEEIYSSCAVVGSSERVGSSNHDFHGDGKDGYVDIAYPTGLLRLGLFAPLYKPLNHLLFTPSDESASRFCNKCGHVLLVTKDCGLCEPTNVNPRSKEDSLNSVVASPELLDQGISSLTSGIPSDDFVNREVSSLNTRDTPTSEVVVPSLTSGTGDTSSLRDGCNSTKGHTSEFSNLSEAQPTDIEFDRVISIRVFEYQGHVYNLSTPHGYFNILDIYTGNTIFRTNLQSAYQAGHYSQAQTNKEDRPYAMLDVVNDSHTSEICADLDEEIGGRAIALDDPIWSRAWPP